MSVLSTPAIGLANPELIAEGERIAKAIFEGGSAGWATLIGKNISSAPGMTDYGKPVELVKKDELAEVLLTRVEWSGDKQGRLYLLVPADCAKTVVALMTALMLGGAPNPEDVKFDADGMDAYSEAINSFFGQAAQQARAVLAGNIKLAVEPAKLIDFSKEKISDVIGAEEKLSHKSMVSIESFQPYQIQLIMTASVTGIEVDTGNEEAESMQENAKALGIDTKNLENAISLKIPLIVLIANKFMRMELIQEMCPGTIIEFKKMSGEMLDVMIGNVKIAEAEVVITNQYFGIQIRRIIDPRAVAR